MKIVPAFGIGTYYKVGSPNAGPNASPMRGLVYLVKNNRNPKPNWLSHPEYKSTAPVQLKNAEEAQSYVASIIAKKMSSLRKAFGFGCKEIWLVPIPSSHIVYETRNDRWGPRGLAQALEHHGVGRLVISLVHHHAIEPSHSAKRRYANELANNLRILKSPPRDKPVLFVDDLITWGNHIAAADAVLGAEQSAAVCVGFTDSEPRLDCYHVRNRIVQYDTTIKGWGVSVLNDSSRIYLA